jgi:hypothetical protein
MAGAFLQVEAKDSQETCEYPPSNTPSLYARHGTAYQLDVWMYHMKKAWASAWWPAAKFRNPPNKSLNLPGCFGRCLCGKVCSNAATSLSLPYLHLGRYFMSAQSCVDQKGYLCTPQFCPVGKPLREFAISHPIPRHFQRWAVIGPC